MRDEVHRVYVKREDVAEYCRTNRCSFLPASVSTNAYGDVSSLTTKDGLHRSLSAFFRNQIRARIEQELVVDGAQQVVVNHRQPWWLRWREEKAGSSASSSSGPQHHHLHDGRSAAGGIIKTPSACSSSSSDGKNEEELTGPGAAKQLLQCLAFSPIEDIALHRIMMLSGVPPTFDLSIPHSLDQFVYYYQLQECKRLLCCRDLKSLEDERRRYEEEEKLRRKRKGPQWDPPADLVAAAAEMAAQLEKASKFSQMCAENREEAIASEKNSPENSPEGEKRGLRGGRSGVSSGTNKRGARAALITSANAGNQQTLTSRGGGAGRSGSDHFVNELQLATDAGFATAERHLEKLDELITNTLVWSFLRHPEDVVVLQKNGGGMLGSGSRSSLEDWRPLRDSLIAQENVDMSLDSWQLVEQVGRRLSVTGVLEKEVSGGAVIFDSADVAAIDASPSSRARGAAGASSSSASAAAKKQTGTIVKQASPAGASASSASPRARHRKAIADQQSKTKTFEPDLSSASASSSTTAGGSSRTSAASSSSSGSASDSSSSETISAQEAQRISKRLQWGLPVDDEELAAVFDTARHGAALKKVLAPASAGTVNRASFSGTSSRESSEGSDGGGRQNGKSNFYAFAHHINGTRNKSRGQHQNQYHAPALVQPPFLQHASTSSLTHSLSCLDGTQNLWLVKPVDTCRGIGIQVLRDFRQILLFSKTQSSTGSGGPKGGRGYRDYIRGPGTLSGSSTGNGTAGGPGVGGAAAAGSGSFANSIALATTGVAAGAETSNWDVKSASSRGGAGGSSSSTGPFSSGAAVAAKRTLKLDKKPDLFADLQQGFHDHYHDDNFSADDGTLVFNHLGVAIGHVADEHRDNMFNRAVSASPKAKFRSAVQKAVTWADETPTETNGKLAAGKSGRGGVAATTSSASAHAGSPTTAAAGSRSPGGRKKDRVENKSLSPNAQRRNAGLSISQFLQAMDEKEERRIRHKWKSPFVNKILQNPLAKNRTPIGMGTWRYLTQKYIEKPYLIEHDGFSARDDYIWGGIWGDHLGTSAASSGTAAPRAGSGKQQQRQQESTSSLYGFGQETNSAGSLKTRKYKFDIRQWVLVTAFSEPHLRAWFYEDCYLRFATHPFAPEGDEVDETATPANVGVVGAGAAQDGDHQSTHLPHISGGGAAASTAAADGTNNANYTRKPSTFSFAAAVSAATAQASTSSGGARKAKFLSGAADRDNFMHLTNNAIVKNTNDIKDFDVDKTMWHSDRFATYLEQRRSNMDIRLRGSFYNASTGFSNKSPSPRRDSSASTSNVGERRSPTTSSKNNSPLFGSTSSSFAPGKSGSNSIDGQPLTWRNIKWQMKRLVWISLQAAAGKIKERRNSFEVFGYDFMVDATGKVWLIEVNSNPDLSYSTSTTRDLVPLMLADAAQVVFGEEKFPCADSCSDNALAKYSLLQHGVRNTGSAAAVASSTLGSSGASSSNLQQGAAASLGSLDPGGSPGRQSGNVAGGKNSDSPSASTRVAHLPGAARVTRTLERTEREEFLDTIAGSHRQSRRVGRFTLMMPQEWDITIPQVFRED